MGSWEATFKGHWPDFPIVAAALQKELLRHPECRRAKVFYVCGMDHFRKCGLHTGMRQGVGVVCVPRAEVGGSKPCKSSGLERPEKLVYVAAPAAGELAGFSSTKVRQALKSSDFKFVCQAISEGASTLLFRPTPDELTHFKGEHAKLGLLPILEASGPCAADTSKAHVWTQESEAQVQSSCA